MIAHPDHVVVYDRAFENYFRSRLRERLSDMFSGVQPARPQAIEMHLGEALVDEGAPDPGAEADEQ
ncbi:MAG: hypothetical protein ACRDJL_08550, partial [Actinomycetota bacterium]